MGLNVEMSEFSLKYFVERLKSPDWIREAGDEGRPLLVQTVHRPNISYISGKFTTSCERMPITPPEGVPSTASCDNSPFVTVKVLGSAACRAW